jgi:squalene-hopene/tetraprenyl-beta-curcumene cyclase
MTPQLQVVDSLLAGTARAASRAVDYFLRTQHDAGYWWAELTADTTLESDYILLQLWLHPPVDGVWNPPTRALIDQAVESILERQLPDGGFNIFPQGPTDLSATVKAYFSLKVAGVAYDDPHLSKARERILAMGGPKLASGFWRWAAFSRRTATSR